MKNEQHPVMLSSSEAPRFLGSREDGLLDVA